MPTSSHTKPRVVFAALALHLFALALTVFFLSFQVVDLLSSAQLGTPAQTVVLGVAARIAGAVLLVYIGMASIQNAHGKRVALAHLVWLLAFTWYGWFSSAAPFILREVLGFHQNLGRAWLLQEFGQVAKFVALAVVYSGIPLWLRRRANIEPLADSRPRLFKLLRGLSVAVFLVWLSLPPIVTRLLTISGDSVYLSFGVLLVVALVSIALCATARQRGSLALLLVEASLAPFVRFLCAGIR